MALVKLKRGDTFAFTADFADAADIPMTGITDRLRSQIRDSNNKLIAEMTVTETDTPGKYLFEALDTTSFPVKQLVFDVQYTGVGGIVGSTPTYTINVERDVTHD